VIAVDETDLDELDQAILSAVTDEIRYKSDIHRAIDYDTSTAAISKRVDKLAENGYLDQTVVSPNHLDAGFLDGFTLTEQGRDIIEGGDSD
jgi:DNA-binding Lrp family transcriptional regulator